MAFRSREEYESWKARQTSSDTPPPTESSMGTTVPSAAHSRPGFQESGGPEPGDIELRLSPLYGVLTLFAGVVFVLLGGMPWNKGGPTFRKEREYSRRNFWINVNLKTKRTDLDAAAQKARTALRAMGRSADFDYTIMENDLPRSGIWFVEECRRRMAAAEAESR